MSMARQTAKARKPRKAKDTGTDQSSVSLPRPMWRTIDRLGELTQWGRSATIARAVELLTALPAPLAQRFVLLSRTPAGDDVRKRYVAAVEAAMRAAESELGASLPLDAPFEELEAALADLGKELQGKPAAKLSEEALIATARDAQAAVRPGRRVRRATAVGRVTSRR
jgi:hypothetical protein